MLSNIEILHKYYKKLVIELLIHAILIRTTDSWWPPTVHWHPCSSICKQWHWRWRTCSPASPCWHRNGLASITATMAGLWPYGHHGWPTASVALAADKSTLARDIRMDTGTDKMKT